MELEADSTALIQRIQNAALLHVSSAIAASEGITQAGSPVETSGPISRRDLLSPQGI